MSLRGPSKTIVVEPLTTPATIPAPAAPQPSPAPAPRREPEPAR